MRTQIVFLTTLLLGTAAAGCFDPYSNSATWREKSLTTGTGGTGGTAGTGGTGGDTGGTTTAPPQCVPGNASMPVDDSCGVFVSDSKGDDGTGKGTKDSPVKTITRGIDLAKANMKPVYVCGENFPGPIELTKSALIYGGLDCATDWKYAGEQGRTVITAEADQVPLQIRGSADLEMHDFNITAVDAVTKGSSSIGILIEAGTSLSLSSGAVEVGNGAPGANADDLMGKGTAGQEGAPGANACSGAVVTGGIGPLNECGDVDSLGGIGGIGALNSGGPGGAGDPGSGMNPNGSGGESVDNQCGHGKPGLAGGTGDDGAGATIGFGTLDPKNGFVGSPGADGQPGKPGQGGGGGGGAKGGTAANQCSAPNNGGASGGSGGSGGCGGAGGKGGGGAGSSIAIVTLGGSLKLDSVKLTVKKGGNGGDGGLGQDGGDGGNWGAAGTKDAASALNDACHGGVGGQGGKGGKGGGGMGGHSIGVAYKSSTPPDTAGAQFTLGTPGTGGTGQGDLGKGADGAAKETQAF